jgi:hypothetical protein
LPEFFAILHGAYIFSRFATLLQQSLRLALWTPGYLLPRFGALWQPGQFLRQQGNSYILPHFATLLHAFALFCSRQPSARKARETRPPRTRRQA